VSDKPISVGDLCVVFRGCCDSVRCLGQIFVFGEARRKSTKCPSCGQVNDEDHAGVANFRAGVPMRWVKRIPPLDELEGVDSREELTA
jgi:hypothetical protein